MKVWETSEIWFLLFKKNIDQKILRFFWIFCIQNPISKDDDVRGPNAILRTPDFGIDIVFRDWLLEVDEKKFLEKYFSMFLFYNKNSISDVSHPFIFSPQLFPTQ